LLWTIVEKQARFIACKEQSPVDIRVDPCLSEAKCSLKNRMRPGPATPTASHVVSCSAWSPLSGGMTASARQRSNERRICRSPLRVRNLAIANPATATVASSSIPLQRAEWGEEAATPGQPVRARAHFWNVPRQSTLENRRLPLALPQSFGKIRNVHVSLQTLSGRSCRPARQKGSVLVKKLWRMILPCGGTRKTKN
jgi:hypothetical protein